MKKITRFIAIISLVGLCSCTYQQKQEAERRADSLEREEEGKPDTLRDDPKVPEQ